MLPCGTESDDNHHDELRPAYNLEVLLKGGVRGKYVEGYREGTNVVVLEPDVALAFPDAASVNEALRLVMRLTQIQRQQHAERGG